MMHNRTIRMSDLEWAAVEEASTEDTRTVSNYLRSVVRKELIRSGFLKISEAPEANVEETTDAASGSVPVLGHD